MGVLVDPLVVESRDGEPLRAFRIGIRCSVPTLEGIRDTVQSALRRLALHKHFSGDRFRYMVGLYDFALAGAGSPADGPVMLCRQTSRLAEGQSAEEAMHENLQLAPPFLISSWTILQAHYAWSSYPRDGSPRIIDSLWLIPKIDSPNKKASEKIEASLRTGRALRQVALPFFNRLNHIESLGWRVWETAAPEWPVPEDVVLLNEMEFRDFDHAKEECLRPEDIEECLDDVCDILGEATSGKYERFV